MNYFLFRFKLFIVISIILMLIGCSHHPRQNQYDTSADFQELTIDEVHHAFREKNLNCVSLIDAYIERINRLDQSTGLNAIILINKNARLRAQTLDKQFARTGKMNALHCIPVILKDNFDTADMPTEAGSIALKGHYPPDDAFLVKKLRMADAIILAKSNMGEWAFSPYETISSTHGETRNAYSLEHVPAGSSGGTASAIAANFGIIGMGTDTGNSVRGPASHLALVGLRPTIGAISNDGIVPLLLNRDTAGPLMRTVKDTAAVFSVLVSDDSIDPSKRQHSDYSQFLDPDGLKGARIGVLRSLTNKPDTDIEILQAMQTVIETLKAAGADIIDPFEIHNLKTLTENTGFCSRFPYDLDNYLKQTSANSPLKSFAQLESEKNYLDISQNAIDWAKKSTTTPDEQNPPCVDVENDIRRKVLLDAVVASMDKEKMDAIIYPSWLNSARKIGDKKSPHGNNSPVIAPHSGQPAITVPMGFTSDGLPLGLQFLGRPFSEGLLLKMAYAYEQRTKHRRMPEKFSE